MIYDDIIYLLFLYCNDIETLINLSKVCKNFYIISKSSLIKEKKRNLLKIKIRLHANPYFCNEMCSYYNDNIFDFIINHLYENENENLNITEKWNEVNLYIDFVNPINSFNLRNYKIYINSKKYEIFEEKIVLIKRSDR